MKSKIMSLRDWLKLVTFLFLGTLMYDTQAQVDCNIVDQELTTSSNTICVGSSGSINLLSSQSGVSYRLRNDSDNSLVGSPVLGNGGAIVLNTGNISAETSFNVFAESFSYGLQFDGINDHIPVSNPVNTASFTMEAWIKTTATSYTGSAAFQGNGLLYADVGGGANDYTFAILGNKILC